MDRHFDINHNPENSFEMNRMLQETYWKIIATEIGYILWNNVKQICRFSLCVTIFSLKFGITK